jgi:hypothetical protein
MWGPRFLVPFLKLPVTPSLIVKVLVDSSLLILWVKPAVCLALSLLSSSLRPGPPLSPVSLQLLLPRPSYLPFFLVVDPACLSPSLLFSTTRFSYRFSLKRGKSAFTSFILRGAQRQSSSPWWVRSPDPAPFLHAFVRALWDAPPRLPRLPLLDVLCAIACSFGYQIWRRWSDFFDFFQCESNFFLWMQLFFDF